MKKILLICAMRKEAIDIIEQLQLSKITENVYKNDKITVLITGVGKQKTLIGFMEYIAEFDKPEYVINIGYAGSTDLEIGKWVNITKSYNYEWYIPGEEQYSMLDLGEQDLEILNEIESVECYSAESFVTSTNLEGHIAFDMELHSIALVCDKYNIPLMSLKKISDNLSLEKYYENIANKNVMELTSCLDLLKKEKII